MAVIEMIDVAKEFGRRRAVHAITGLSLTVERGTMMGYAGPNGAGKSTTVKMLTGILSPTSGRIRVAGFEPARERTALARRIGVVFGQRTQLWWDLPLRDSLDLLRHVYSVPPADHAATRAMLVEQLDLGPLLDRPVRQLSLGQRVRADLAAALLHRPQILFLDEPTIGLDIVSRAQVHDLLTRTNRDDGTTVLLTTHDMDDIERLCSRLVIIDHGRIVHDGDVASLRGALGDESILVITTAEAQAALDIPGATTVRVDGPRQWLSFHRDRLSAPALIDAVNQRARLLDLRIEEPPIEDVVRRIYQGSQPGRGD
jgi:ABC-2 type transport system ATP-binding protein